MQRLEIPEIIAYLNTQSTVTNLVSNRIFWGFPKSEQAGNYLVLEDITENQDVVDAMSRIEFRFISKDDAGKWSELYTIERAITNILASKGRINLGTTTINDVTIGSSIVKGYDEKKRKIYLRDYLFYYLS